MKTASVNSKSFISGGYRIDPDIYLSEGAQVRKELCSLPYELSNVGENSEKVFLGNIFLVFLLASQLMVYHISQLQIQSLQT